MRRLEGKVAFITGTAGGQGRAAARLFAAEGAFVVGCDIQKEKADETVELVRTAGGQMISMAPVDLGSRPDARRWIEEGISAAGRIDILYNNAGALKFAPIGSMTAGEWEFTIRNELDLIFHTTQAAWPHLLANGQGAIINTASGSGLRGTAKLGSGAHAAAKAGVMGFTRQAAAEGARHRIRVNCISPGAIEPPAGSAYLDEATKAAFVAGIPLGFWGQPEDIAYCALYLGSDEARWVTGATFVIDGGVNAAR